MPKPKLVIVHGMGQHTAASFQGEVLEGLSFAFNLYEHLAGKSPQDYVELVSVEYNSIFDAARERMKKQALPVKERLGGIEGMDAAAVQQALSALVGFQARLGDDGFFNTHWLDVFLYRFTTIGELVRIHIGAAITQTLASVHGGTLNGHVLAHSLGTSVVHDTLAKLYGSGPDNLNVDSQQMGSLHLVANTSRVLASFIAVDKSLTRPGVHGCCEYFREYRHQLDPITWPLPFNPHKGDGWIAADAYDADEYQLIKLHDVTNAQGNTHDIRHYLANPDVHQQLFERVLGIKLTVEQRTEGRQKYQTHTLAEVAENLKLAFNDLNNLDIDSLEGLIEAARQAKVFVEGLGGQYDL
ncbi:hypothetical protein [Shewanella sp. GXUN23E]|uniref:hypothetical protein n=1 Tax=Shewanella sp. GXUN23E TaxID=3422498 RepID=UPI003D7EAC1F